jgi:hypothetical protein
VLVPALPLLAFITWWTLDDGGYAPTQWLPGTVATLALLAIVVMSRPRDAAPLSRPSRIALGLLAAYAAWSYLSIAWADDPGVALQGSHRALLYAAFPITISLLPWTPELLRRAIGIFIAIVFVAAVVCLFKLHGATSTAGLFLDRRLSFPTGYHNATAALFTMAAIPSLVLASRRDVRGPLRAAALGAATLFEGLALMSQSRSWLFTLPVVLLAVIALVRQRVRIVVFLLPVAGGVAAVSSRLLEPYRLADGHPIDSVPGALAAAHDVVTPLVIVTLAAAAAGAVLALADRRIHLDEQAERRVRRGAVAVTVAAAVIGAGAGLAAEPHPIDRLDSAWKTFKHYNPTRGGMSSSRFSGLGTGRYDIWRVALNDFVSHPVTGLGQDNFVQSYLRHRRTDEEPRWTHSLPLRALGHTGAVGFLLLFGALATLLWGAIAARRVSPGAGEAAAIAIAPLIVWVIHGSFDWLWEYPALTLAALGLAAVGATLGVRPGAAPPDPAERRRGHEVRRVLVLAGAVLLLVAPALDDVAELDTRAAQTEWRTDAAGAFARLHRAEGLTPSSRPYLVEGLIARQLARRSVAERAFAEAHRRLPQDWFALLNLGLLASERGDRAGAIERYRAAQALNPGEPLLREAVSRYRGKRPLTFAEVVVMLTSRTAQRIGQR